MHHFKTLSAIQRRSRNAHALKVVQQIIFNAFQTGLRIFEAVRFNAKGDVLGFHQTVIALGELRSEHLRIFLTDFIEFITLFGYLDGRFKSITVDSQVQAG